MAISPLAGKPAPKEVLVDLAKLERLYYERRPDLADPNQLVSFGTSGHRGSSLSGTFTESHILAITQAICDHRQRHRVDGPLYMGKDTHALSGPAQRTALEVLAANGVETVIQPDDGVTPTPVISRCKFSSSTKAAAAGIYLAADGIVESLPRTIRRMKADSSTTRPTAARPTPTSPSGFKIGRTSCCAPAMWL